jgi:hypothetical protein
MQFSPTPYYLIPIAYGYSHHRVFKYLQSISTLNVMVFVSFITIQNCRQNYVKLSL